MVAVQLLCYHIPLGTTTPLTWGQYNAMLSYSIREDYTALTWGQLSCYVIIFYLE